MPPLTPTASLAGIFLDGDQQRRGFEDWRKRGDLERVGGAGRCRRQKTSVQGAKHGNNDRPHTSLSPLFLGTGYSPIPSACSCMSLRSCGLRAKTRGNCLGGNMHRRGLLASLAAALAAPALGRSAFAQAWPSRPIRAICPFSAGSTIDILGRVVTDPLAQALGQSVVGREPRRRRRHDRLVHSREGGGGRLHAADQCLGAHRGAGLVPEHRL